MKPTLVLSACLLAGAATASAANLVFDENAFPNNPINGFGTFTFDDFGAAGAVTTTADAIVLDVVDTNASNGVFGGVGVDFVLEDPPASGTFVPQDFDASTHEWRLSVKLLPGNAATGLNATFIDDDGAGSADDHQFNFDLTGVPADGQFHLLTVPADSPGFTQGGFGFTPGDGIVNPGLRQIQIQSQFGSTGRLNVEIDFLQIAPVIPEPTSVFLLGAGATLLATRRRV